MQYAVKMQQKASEQLFLLLLSQFMFLAKQVQSPNEKTDPLSLFKKQIDNLAETLAPLQTKNCSTLLRHSTISPP